MTFSRSSKGKAHVCVASAVGRIKGECTIERVALVMNIVPCRELNLMCSLEKDNRIIELSTEPS